VFFCFFTRTQVVGAGNEFITWLIVGMFTSRLAQAAISTLQHQLHQRYVRKKKVSLYLLLKKMNNWNLQQRINIQFHVSVGKSACETCAMSSDAHGTEAMRNQAF
jgi:hypothetical protein